MTMQDVLQKIKLAETQAEQMVQAAKADVAKRLEKTEVECEAIVKRAVNQAKQKAEHIIEQGLASARANAGEIALQSDVECVALRKQASLRLNTAVKLIRERIMTRDGRS